ncbi:MAG: serine protease [Blastopirellula sp.]|nr:MAG: serine protease [Blastopirellula sp.]
MALMSVCAVHVSFAQAVELPKEVLAGEQARIAAIAKASVPSICVFAGAAGGGSGVLISADGYALTNYHVAKPAGNFMKCSLPEGNVYDAVIVGIDPTGDVALIKLLGRDDFPFAEIADSDSVEIGDWCFAVGNPFLLATDLNPSISWGIVSGVHRYQYPSGTLLEYADCIQTDAAINPGNSGGPLFNSKGQLIGINGRGSFEKRGRVNVGVGYAISINQIMHFLGYLKSGRIVDHATLGATVSTDNESRVLVTNILSSSDAYRRGLRYSDEIVSFGGRSITTVNGFKNVLGIFPRAWKVPLVYLRDGERHEITVQLAGVHSREELLHKLGGAPVPPSPDGDEKKPKPMPRPGHPATKKSKPPEEWKHLFEERVGYANYHFNITNRDRVWKAILAQTDLSSSSATWEIDAKISDGDDANIRLEEDQLVAVIAGKKHGVDLASDLSRELAPAGTGGLLLALHTWKHLLQTGPAKYGEVYYLGTAPLDDIAKQYDVLVGVHDILETRFYVDQETGEIAAIEMFSDQDEDPCEIRFSDYRTVDEITLPHRFLIRHGDEVYDVFDIKKWNFDIPEATVKAEGETE